MFLGYYDPAKKVPSSAKFAAAVARYRAKFEREPEVALCHPEDAAELGTTDVPVRPVNFLPRHTFYVGEDEQ